MTRTERAMFPRAIIRDRSESKSGLDKSLRKAGGGQHNWGSLRDELRNETAALDDEFTEEELWRLQEMDEENDGDVLRKYGLDSFSPAGMYPTLSTVPPDVNAAVRPAVDTGDNNEPAPPSPTGSSPTTSAPSFRLGAASFDNDHIEEARRIRARGFKGNLDLSAIARTSVGAGRAASTSPPAK